MHSVINKNSITEDSLQYIEHIYESIRINGIKSYQQALRSVSSDADL